MNDYTILDRFAPGLAVMHSLQHPRQLFSTARMRKDCACANCKEAIQKGATAYRPVGNDSNRYVRLCVMCVEGWDYAHVR